MLQPFVTFDTGHEDDIHDVQFDYYGKRAATCCWSGSVKVFQIDQGTSQPLADLVGHAGPVWKLAWAHPKHGNMIASAGFDHTVIVWKERSDGQWELLHRTDPNLHTGSISGVDWAPHELGLVFVAASADGFLSVHTCDPASSEWSVSFVAAEGNLPAHPMGVTSVSFAPALEPGALSPSTKYRGPTHRFASGGSDQALRLWNLGQDGVWRSECAATAFHTAAVSDVAWGPNIGLPRNCVATAGRDGKVVVWEEEASNPGVWTPKLVHDYGKDKPVWTVSWSVTGAMICAAAAAEDAVETTVGLFKQAVDGKWEAVDQGTQ